MKIFASLFFFFVLISFPELSEVRKQYILASDSKAQNDKLLDMLATVTKEDNKTLVAYKGASLALRGKFSTKKEEKRNYFLEGVQLLESAQKTAPKNLEIRLIRLSIQENTPKILKYKQNIAEDKEFILSNFSKQNASLKELVRLYVKQSKVFTEEEKIAMQ